MATVSMATWTGDPTGYLPVTSDGAVRKCYLVGRELNIASAVTSKGTALAQGDIIEVVNIPRGTAIIAGFAKKTAAMTGTSTDLTFDIGVTGVDDDVFVDGWDFDGAATPSYATPQGVQTPPIVIGLTNDTVDILIKTMTGTLTGGKVWVGVLCVDIDPVARPGLAALQS